MKKIKYLSIALASILFVTGCGKKVTCTYTLDGENDVKMTAKLVMKVKDDKIVSVEEITEIEAPKAEDSDWKELVEMVKEDTSTEGYEGIKISQNTNDSKHTYTAKVEADLSKVNDKAKEDFDLDTFIDAKSVDDVIKEYEENGFKCEK